MNLLGIAVLTIGNAPCRLGLAIKTRNACHVHITPADVKDMYKFIV